MSPTKQAKGDSGKEPKYLVTEMEGKKTKKQTKNKPSEKPSSVGWGGLFILWSDETSMVWSAFCSDSS